MQQKVKFPETGYEAAIVWGTKLDQGKPTEARYFLERFACAQRNGRPVSKCDGCRVKAVVNSKAKTCAECEEIRVIVGAEFRALRESLGKSRWQLADMIKSDSSAMYRIETKKIQALTAESCYQLRKLMERHNARQRQDDLERSGDGQRVEDSRDATAAQKGVAHR